VEHASAHPLTLRFRSDALEAAFRADSAAGLARYVRWPMLLGGLLFVGYGFLDEAIAPAHAGELWIVRLAVTSIIAVVLLRLVWPAGGPTVIAMYSVVALAAGAGLSASAWYWADAGRLTAHTGVVILLIYVHVLSRMPFVVVTALGWTISIAYMVVIARHPAPTSLDLVEQAAAIVSANITGMVASYLLERYARRVFVQQRTVEARGSELQRQTDTLRETNEYLASAIGEVRQAQEQLVQQEKMASLGRLTAGVAHEIKNPLNFVNNFASLNGELLEELRAVLGGDDAAPIAELVNALEVNARRIEAHGRRADGIVRSMLSHARAGAGVRVPTDLNALVSEHVDLAYHAFRAGGRAVNPAVTRDFGPQVGTLEVDPVEIGRVVVNLVGNAFDAVEAGAREAGTGIVPAVTIATRRRDGAIELTVEDNGTGVAPEARPHLFEPFFTTKSPGAGTGLGLSLAYEIVTRHGGTLEHRSPSGGGAAFVVKLPG